MKAVELACICAFAVSIVITGCNSKMPFRHLGQAATQPPAPVSPPPSSSSAPYALAAECAGPYITFTVANMGTTDLPVKKEDFALVVPGGEKKVIPYDKQTDIIDLPPNSVIPPQQTIKGRARFKRYPAPVGTRLVFKPDNLGTYAHISTQANLRASTGTNGGVTQ